VKINLLLTFLLAGLISVAYLYEEKGENPIGYLTEHERAVEFKNDQILSISLKNTKVFKDKYQWVIGELNYPADSNKMKTFIKSLSGIKKLKVIESKDNVGENFFQHQDHPFIVQTFDKEIFYRLGDISPVTGHFYLERSANGKKELFLCEDTNVYDGIYKSKLEAEYQKYLRLKDLVSMLPMALIEENLFIKFNWIGVQSVKIDNKRNRWFEVNFEKQETIPNVTASIEYKNVENVFKSLLKSIRVFSIYTNKSSGLDEKLATVEIKKPKSITTIELYGTLDGQNGYFVKLDGNDLIYQIEEKASVFFYSNVQDFWNKKIHYNQKLSEIKTLDFSVGDRPKNKVDFFVNDLTEFKFETKDKRVNGINTSNFNFLFNLVLGLTEFREAKFITSSAKHNAARFKLYVDILDKKLCINFFKSQIIVSDIVNKVDYFYPFNNSLLKASAIEDFFTLNVKI